MTLLINACVTGNSRTKMLADGAFQDPLFGLARQFAAADRIVIAAPYWDLSFPAALKQYVEQINVLGITFIYTRRVPRRDFARQRNFIMLLQQADISYRKNTATDT